MQVERAARVMELLIGNFSSSALFGAEAIEFFTSATKTNISRTEKYCYEFAYNIYFNFFLDLIYPLVGWFLW